MKKPLLEDLQAHWESHVHFITQKIQTFGNWIPRLLTRWYCNGLNCGLDQIVLVDSSGRRLIIVFYHHSLSSITFKIIVSIINQLINQPLHLSSLRIIHRFTTLFNYSSRANNTKYLLVFNISTYKLCKVGISSNLIGSLSLANDQCPPPRRWIICRVNSRLVVVTEEEIFQMLTFLDLKCIVLSPSLYTRMLTPLFSLISVNSGF